VALEWNDYGNDQRGAEVRAACAARGLVFTIWLTRPFDADTVRKAVLDSQAAGIALEAEIPAHVPEAPDWPSIVNEIADLPVYKAVVTNFAAFVHPDAYPWPEKAAPLVEAGWHCLTECYVGEAPNATPENTDWYARTFLGWPETQPVIGIYAGATFDDYPTRDRYRNWSVWDAGEVLV